MPYQYEFLLPITDGMSLCMSHIKHLYVSITGISEPDVIVCEGGGAGFSCELNTSNTNISDNDVQWYRLIKDTGTIEKIMMNSSITFITNTIENVSTTTLNITNAERSFTGYYWAKSQSTDICNVSVTVGTSMCIEC